MAESATLKYVVPSISCEGCAGAIRRILGAQDGVREASVDVASKQVTVEYDPDLQDDARLRSRLSAAGYAPED